MNIQEIAKLAGVSISTVSKVMNGKDKDIGEETREKVMRIVEENHYMPYAKFREKERIVNHIIGLIIKRKNPYYTELIDSIEDALKKNDFYLIVYTVDYEKKEIERALDALKKRGVSGVLIDSSCVICSNREERPIVYLAYGEDFENEQKNTFYFRNYEAGRRAAEKLLKAGHQRIGCLLSESDRVFLKGVESVYREQHYPKEAVTSYLGKSMEDVIENGLEICINDNQSAVIAGNAEIIGCILRYAEQIGMKIPEECSLLCAKDDDILNYLLGGVTAVSYPVRRMGEEAVTHLLKMIIEKQESEIVRGFESMMQERNTVRDISRKGTFGKIAVVGSMNMDSIIEGVLIPLAGETVIAKNLLILPGGKGANQAVGVGKLGGEAYMIGRLGRDVEGRIIYKSLADNGVHMEGIEFDECAASGKAFVHIDQNGENAIVVYQGANENLDEIQLKRHEDIFKDAKYCLLSSEISRAAMIAAKEICRTTGTEIICKPSAIEKIEEEILLGIEYLVPNEKEMNHIFPERKMSMEEKAEKLLKLGVKNIIVTLGKSGAYLKNEKYSMYFEGNPFMAIDTTGGADAFISAMAVALSERKELIYAIIYASYAAGITVTRYGVQEAMPDKKMMRIYQEDIEKEYLKKMEEYKNEKNTGAW